MGERWRTVSFFFLLSNKCVSLLSDIHRPSKPKARERRQVNEGKSRVKRFLRDSEYDEVSIWSLSGLWIVKRKL